MSECGDCPGYDVFSVDRDPDLEIERCDGCAKYEDDDAAAVAFVRDLERGEPGALEMARQLVAVNTDATVENTRAKAQERTK